jgi:hypothetical protein
MKKVFTFIAAIAFVASMSSCKKDWSCSCKVDGQEVSSGTFNAKKKDAQDACDALGKLSAGSVSCELKKK